MGVEVTTLFDLDENSVAARRSVLSQLLQELHPTYWLKRGVIHDLNINTAAAYNEMHRLYWDRARRASSLKAINEDPALADTDIVDATLSNLRIVRLAGEQAHGQVTIVVRQLSSVTIPAQSGFSANGLRFVTRTAFSARERATQVITATDRLLSPLSDGTYAFVIELWAEDEGEAGRLKKNTVVVPEAPPVNFVKAYTEADFAGGFSAESNLSLVSKALSGVAAKAFSGRLNMSASLREQTGFDRIVADSLIGLGDPEMQRDQHTIWPGSLGGRADWYVRTQEQPHTASLTKTATLVERTSDGYGIWQFSIGRDELPGFYDVTQIRPNDSADYTGTYAITEDVRGRDMTELDNDGFLPDIASDAEAAYTRFQTATIRFKDTTTLTTLLTPYTSTQEYAVAIRGMPLIAEIQDYASSRSVRNAMGDVLVRAAVPCFLKLSLTLQLMPGQSSPDVAAIKNALSLRVNQTGFPGRMPAAWLTDIVQSAIAGDSYVDSIDVLGRVLRPDGTFRLWRTTETLTVHHEPAQLTTARTVVFVLDPADISISVVTADMPQI